MNLTLAMSQAITESLMAIKSKECTILFGNALTILASPHPKSAITACLFLQYKKQKNALRKVEKIIHAKINR